MSDPLRCPRSSRLPCLAAIGLVGVLLPLVTTVRAQGSDQIVTDRPDFVEASLTVGKGVFQFETSVSYADDSTGGVDTEIWATPTLFRYGIYEMWELRLETDGLSHQQTTVAGSSFSDSESGIADTSLGAKWHTVDGEGGRPSQAWLFHVDLATASSLFGREGARPSVRWTAEWELTHGFGVGVMPGLVWERDERGRYLRGVFGAVVGKNFTATFKGFAEVAFRQIASSTHGGDVVTGDLGVAGLIGDDWQWDAALVIGLNDDTPDTTVTVGLSGRF